MPYFTTSNSKIVGMSAVVPKNRFDESDFIKHFGEEAVKKFVKSTGVHSLHRALDKQTASDLGYVAANSLLNNLSVNREKIGALVFVTQSPDYRRPASSCVLQKRLGLPNDCAAFDIGLGCSGFIYGHQIISSMLDTADVEYGLLILGETASKLVNPDDKSIAMMYGDAGAAVLYHKESNCFSTTLLKSDGNRFKSIILPAGGFRDMYPGHEKYMCSDGIERTKYDVFMNGLDVFSFSTSDVPKTIREYLDKTNTKAEEYDIVALHQANQFILKQISKKIGADMSKVPITLDRYGNTGGISIPLTLCDILSGQEGKKHILASGFGIGLSWGVTSFELQAECVFPVSETDNYYKDGVVCPGEF